MSNSASAIVLNNKKTIMLLGTDTSATAFEVQNNSAAAKFKVDGAGDATISSSLTVQSATNSTSSSTGAVLVTGGIGVAKQIYSDMGMYATAYNVHSDEKLKNIYIQNNILSTESNTKLLGLAIYKDYLYQFEIAGAILLVAIIAAISLSMSKSKITKSSHPHEQVLAKKEDRLRIVKMKSEEKKT